MFIGELLLYWLYIWTVDSTISTKRTASKKLRRGYPDSLTLWLEKVDNKRLSSSPTSVSSVIDSSHLSATSFSLLELVDLQVEG